MRGVFTRAKDPNGKWGACDAMDLTDESFRSFVLHMLYRLGAVSAVNPTPPMMKELERREPYPKVEP